MNDAPLTFVIVNRYYYRTVFHKPCSVKVVAFVRKTGRGDVWILIEIDWMVEF